MEVIALVLGTTSTHMRFEDIIDTPLVTILLPSLRRTAQASAPRAAHLPAVHIAPFSMAALTPLAQR